MSERIISPWLYYAVFAALIVLTAATVAMSFLELGSGHTYWGLAIAAGKASLVVLFFMHVWFSSRVTWIVVASTLFWLAIILALTATDYLTRWPGATY